jgi:hypothetical protein
LLTDLLIYEENIIFSSVIDYSIKLDKMEKTITLLLIVFAIFNASTRFSLWRARMSQTTFRGETDGGLFKTKACASILSSYQFNKNID